MTLREIYIRGIVGIGMSLIFWLILFFVLPDEHNPADGIVGSPAFRNYSERREKILYVAAHACTALCCALSFVRFPLFRIAPRVPDYSNNRTPDSGATDTHSVTLAQTDVLNRKITLLLSIGIYCLFFFVAWFDAPFDTFHEGARLNYTQASMDGKIPYRDYDCVYGLWYGVLQHLTAFTIYGENTVKSAHRFSQWLAPFLPVCMYLLCLAATGRVLPSLAGLGLASLLMFAPPFLNNWPVDHHGFSTRHAWPALSVALLLWYIQSPKRSVIFQAGLCVGLATLWPLQSFIVPLGSFVTIVVVLPFTKGFSFRTTLQTVFAFSAGMLLGALPLIVYLVTHEALMAFFQYHYKILAIHSSWNGEMFPLTLNELASRYHWTEPSAGLFLWFTAALMKLFLGSAWVTPEQTLVLWVCGLYFYLPPLITLAACVRIGYAVSRFRFSRFDVQLIALTAASFLFFVSAIERSDGQHAAYGALLHVPLLLFMLKRIPLLTPFSVTSDQHNANSNKFNRLSLQMAMWKVTGLVLIVIMIAPAIYFIGMRVRDYAKRDQFKMSPQSMLGRLHDIPHWGGTISHASFLDEMGSYILKHSSPEDTLIDLSDAFSAHFLYDRAAPGRFYYGYDAVSPQDQAQIIQQLPNTDLVIVPVDQGVVDGIPVSARFHYVMEHLLQQFTPEFAFSGYVVMRRSTDSGSSTHTEPHQWPWMDSVPRRMRLAFLPYFGESLFSPAIFSGTDGAASREIRFDASPSLVAASHTGERTGHLYQLHLPENPENTDLIKLDIHYPSGIDSRVFMGWKIAQDQQAERGWRLEFALHPNERKHTYVIKLASIPQWVWGKHKQAILVDLPETARLIDAHWHSYPKDG